MADVRAALVRDLSTNTRAVLALRPGGAPDSLTIVRGGTDAFVLSAPEAKHLRELLNHPADQTEEA